MNHESDKLSLYKSGDSECGYLPGLSASSLFANPYDPPDPALYDHLIRFGFRRSGNLVYRPDCTACRRCISVRLRVCDFAPNRRFRRILKKNLSLQTFIAEADFNNDYFALYRLYLSTQHRGGSMDNPTPEDFKRFLLTRWSETLFLEIRGQNNKLLAVAVTDVVEDGLSSVYTFYDPAEKARSPGQFSILQQIELTRQKALPYLYLGYWIADCRKMTYKADYQPLEYFY